MTEYKKRQRAPHKARTEIYLEPHEKVRLQTLAKELNISLSELCRRLLLDKPLPNPERLRGVRSLMSLKADLARLGNLLRALDRRTTRTTDASFDEAFHGLRGLKDKLSQKIDELCTK